MAVSLVLAHSRLVPHHYPHQLQIFCFNSPSTRIQIQPAESMSEVAPVNYGILGCAGIARKVSRAISLAAPDAAVYAVASRSVDNARLFAAANNISPAAKIYGSYDELLDDPCVDAVYMPLPTSLHLKWAVRAAQRNKHILVEKPVAVNVAEFDHILEACESNGVQIMDGTMWVHHPRTNKMQEFLCDQERFGRLKHVQATFTFAADDEFLQNDIRVKSDLDALGALGDVGWYCIRANLWAANYQLPKLVTASRGAVTNEAGVIMSCGATLHWEDGTTGSLYCSFTSHLTMEVTVMGSKGTLSIKDFVVPYEENTAGFSTANATFLKDNETAWSWKPTENWVATDLPQECLMVKEFSSLVRKIKVDGSKPEKKWSVLSRKTLAVMDAVKASIEKGYEPVELVY